MKRTSLWGLMAGPLLMAALMAYPGDLVSPAADPVLALGLWMIVWWISEAVSISVTALLPLLVMPLLGILPLDQVGGYYGSPIIFLFFGGFVMALALEKVGLHRRIALNIIQKTGTSPASVLLGFMIATGFLSMWISNTATVVLMLPIAQSVIHLLIEDSDGFTKEDRNFALSVMLGIAFAANAGGIATVIGTPPNSVLIGLLENEYHQPISFMEWMALGFPLAVLLIAVIYWVLLRLFPFKSLAFKADQNIIADSLKALGAMDSKEKQVLVVFGTTVFLWIFRAAINQLVPGLGLTDTAISLFGALSLFCIPTKDKKAPFILAWSDTKNLSWGILILFGGGLALANGMTQSGLVDLVSFSIQQQQWPVIGTVVVLIALMLFLTELMSNVALVAVLAPVVAGIALGLDIPIIHLLIPVTIASSCAFMLPMATPPNAIVFASGYIEVKDMVRAGIWLNLISVGLLTAVYQWVIPWLF